MNKCPVCDSVGPCIDFCSRGNGVRVAELQAEIEQLQRIVDTLPRTADGVPIVPGMLVQVKGYIPFTAEVWSISPSGVVICRGGGSYIPKELCSVQGARP